MSFGIVPNKENPRASDINQVDCSRGITVSCDENNCNVIVLTDADGKTKRLFKNLIVIRAVNQLDNCTSKDYRREQEAFKPHVLIYGKDASNNENFLKDFFYTVYPEDGVSNVELAQSIIDRICECSAGPEPPKPPVFGSVFNFLWEQTVEGISTPLEVINWANSNVPAGIYEISWSLQVDVAADNYLEGNIEVNGAESNNFTVEGIGRTNSDTRSGSLRTLVTEVSQQINVLLNVNPNGGTPVDLSKIYITYKKIADLPTP